MADLNATIINETGMPDAEIVKAVREQVPPVIAERYLEIASFNPGFAGGSFSQVQSTPAGLFVRGVYRRPTDIIGEMELAVDLFEEDDDVGSTVGFVIKTLFQGMKHLHSDPATVALFDQLADNLAFNTRFREITKWLSVVGQCYPVKVFSPVSFPNFKPGQNPRVIAPNLISLNPLSVRVADTMGDGTPILVQEVDDLTHQFLLDIGKGDQKVQSAAQLVKRSDNPIAAALYVKQYVPNLSTTTDPLLTGLKQAWYLNPQMVTRYALESDTGDSNYAPVPLKRVFGLCEAKRLLNMFDYSMLQGGINFLIVVKKGSEAQPARQEEINNLQGIVQTAARTGILVGDHRLSVEIITPKMDEMLSDVRRSLLARKITRSLLCLPDTSFGRIEGGGTPEAEIISGNLTGDRQIIADLLNRDVYQATVAKNLQTFSKGAPKIWFPPISIAGNHFFADAMLKLRDRGDVPRSWAVESVGLDAESALAERQREVAAGFDKVMTAQNVPATAQPSVANGRPAGAKTNANVNGNPDTITTTNTGG